MSVFCEARNNFISLGLKYVARYLCYINVSVILNLFKALHLLLIIPRLTEVSKPIKSNLLYLDKRKIQISRYTPSFSYVSTIRTFFDYTASKKRYSFCLMVEVSDHGYVLHTRRIYVFSINGG
jgi:hypothetical protein